MNSCGYFSSQSFARLCHQDGHMAAGSDQSPERYSLFDRESHCPQDSSKA